MPSEPLTTLVLKNRSLNPIIIKRAKSGLEVPLIGGQGIGLKIYDKEGAFLSIDFDNRTIWMDLGADA